MLSQTCKAAIKAVIYLSSKPEDSPRSTIKEIASHIEVSEHTLGKLLQVLVRTHIICSEKGPSGGFYINKSQLKLPVMHIIEAIDGKEIFKECALGLTKCNNSKPCSIHNQYKEARDLLLDIFNNNKIGDLGKSINQGLTFLSN